MATQDANRSRHHGSQHGSSRRKKSGFSTKLAYEMAVARNDRRGTFTMVLITLTLLALVWFIGAGTWPILDGHAVCGHALSLVLGWESPGGASNSEVSLINACRAHARQVMTLPSIALAIAVSALILWLVFGAKKKRKRRHSHRSHSSSRHSSSSRTSSSSRSDSTSADD